MSRSPTPRRRATLASLAAELKVSRTTISNAYNRPDQLSADLRERVLATAKRLGYAGPRSGRPLAADPQGRRRRAGDHRAAELFVQRSRGAGLRRGPRGVVRGGGPGSAAGRGRAEPQRQRRVGRGARGGCRRLRGVLRVRRRPVSGGGAAAAPAGRRRGPAQGRPGSVAGRASTIGRRWPSSPSM